jgi:molybdopterin-guanine dinucleotide biosynthesis protein A
VIIVLDMAENLNKVFAPEPIGVIIAGGQSRRFGGGDKFLNKLNGKPILNHVLERVRPQVSELIINSNSNTTALVRFGCPVIADIVQGFVGPLAGVLTGMEWASTNTPECRWIATFPADAPFIPRDCLKKMKLYAEKDLYDIICVSSGGRTHPVCALWRIDLANELRLAIVNEEMRKIDLWTARYRLATIEFLDQPFDPFFNINRPEDLEIARAICLDLE